MPIVCVVGWCERDGVGLWASADRHGGLVAAPHPVLLLDVRADPHSCASVELFHYTGTRGLLHLGPWLPGESLVVW